MSAHVCRKTLYPMIPLLLAVLKSASTDELSTTHSQRVPRVLMPILCFFKLRLGELPLLLIETSRN